MSKHADVVWNTALQPTSDPRRFGEHVYLLVDHSGCDGLLDRLRASTLPWISLFEGTTETNAAIVAPYLIDFGAVGEIGAGSARLLRVLTDQCLASNAILLIRSSWTHRALAAALKHRLDAVLPDAMDVLLRYFDSRIFKSLMEVMHADQRAAFLGVASSWWWLDRAGTPHHIDSTEGEGDSLTRPLQLDAAQQARMIDASTADAVMLLVSRYASELRLGLTNAELHAFVSRCLLIAQRYLVDTITMQQLFCITALAHGPTFHEEPPWSDALQRAMTQGRDFAWVIDQVEAGRA